MAPERTNLSGGQLTKSRLIAVAEALQELVSSSVLSALSGETTFHNHSE
jgi:hypothetical protein